MIGSNWTYVVVGVCLLLAIVMVWLEIRRVNKSHLIWRILAVVAAVAMLVCIALPVSYQKNVSHNDQRVILLTKGFTADSLGNESTAYTLDRSIKKDYPKATLLNGFDELADTLKGASLYIQGDGLRADELQELEGVAIIFHQPKLPDGVTALHWDRLIKSGEEMHVQGRYNNTSASAIKLLLKGLNTVADTMTIKAGTASDFDLSTTPETTGKIVYTLETVSDGDTLRQGEIPVQINVVKPLKVLMLSASPDFETRFLKNWLSDQGYGVAARAVISKDKISSDFINMPQFPLERITTSSFGKFDLVIGDLSTLNSLSGSEAAALRQEVTDKGLGVIIRADSTGKSSWLQQKFPIEKGQNAPVTSALLINSKRSASAKLGYGAVYIKPADDTQPIIVNTQNRILASSTLAGPGKLVFTTLNNTYSWSLAGEQKDYSAVWSALINSAARKDKATLSSIETSSLPYVNEPVTLLMSKSNNNIKVNGGTVATEQDRDIPFEQTGTYWPQKSGWQSVELNGEVAWWYAFSDQDWQGVRAAEKIAATAKHADSHLPQSNVTKQIHQKIRIEVPKIYFYILLLAACTFLWIENKFS